MTRPIRTLLCCALALLSFSAFAATASAEVFCVGAGTGCTETFSFDSAGVDQAVDAYQATDSLDDILRFAPGTITFSSALVLADGAWGDLEVLGAGSGKTKLVFNAVDGENLRFNFSGDDDVKGFSVELTGDTLSSRTGVALNSGQAEDVYVQMPPGNHRAFGFTDTTSCVSCRARVSGPSIGFHVGAGNATILDSKAEVYDPSAAVHTRGVSMEGPLSQATVSRTKLINFNRGLFGYLGNLTVKDSLIDLGNQVDALGLEVDVQSPTDANPRVSLDGVTIVGSGETQRGLSVTANASGAGSVTVNFANSLSWLTGDGATDVYCFHGGSLPLSVGLSFSMAEVISAQGTCAPVENTLVSGTPTFVDAAAGDYRPAPGSPVIDAGDPTSGDAGRFDLWGATRYVNGSDFNFAGDIDLGAGEYQNYAPNKPSVTATPTTVFAGSPVTFSATGTDPNGDVVSFSWEFSEGGSASGATVSHTYAAPGTYKAKAIASDGKLSRASAWVEVTVIAAPPVPLASIVLGKPTAKFKYTKKKAKPFALGSASSRARIPLTTNFAGEVILTMAKIKGGWTSGKKCVAKKPEKGKSKRCDRPLKGSLKLKVPAGVSFLTFGGKWGRSALPSGRYRLTVSAAGTAHDIALNSIRNMK